MADTPSQAALGRLLNLSPAAVTKLKKQGMPVHSLEAAQAWRIARQNVAARKPLPGAHVREAMGAAPREWPAAAVGDDAISIEDRDAARTRREVAEANIAEIEEKRMRGEVMKVAAVRARMAHEYATARDGLLQLAARVAPVLAAESDPAAVERLLYAEIHAALTTLAHAPVSITQAAEDEDTI
jgi:hypothetical protein